MSYVGMCPACSKALWSEHHAMERHNGVLYHVDCAPMPGMDAPIQAGGWAPSGDAPVEAKPTWTEPAKVRSAQTKQVEEQLAKDFGGRRLRASGAGARDTRTARQRKACGRGKGKTEGADVTMDKGVIQLHLEHKRTEAKSYAVSRKTMQKVVDGARHAGKEPALVLLFEGGCEPIDEWVLLPKRLVLQLLEGYNEA